jgi:hypothetical protein
MNFLSRLTRTAVQGGRRTLMISKIPMQNFGHFKVTPEEKKEEIKTKEEILKTEKWTMPHPVWTE